MRENAELDGKAHESLQDVVARDMESNDMCALIVKSFGPSAGAARGEMRHQQIDGVHSPISDLSRSRRSFAARHASDYVTWIAWMSLDDDENIGEKMEVLKNLKVLGKSAALIAEVKAAVAARFPKNLIQNGE